MARKFGEPPGQTRSYNSRPTAGRLIAAKRKKQRSRAKSDSLASLPGNVVKYYRDNPSMLVEDVMAGIPGLAGIAIGRKAQRGDNADAALSAAALVPGLGIGGKAAKVANVAAKASKAATAAKTGTKAGTAAVKKATKTAAAKKVAKTTPAKKAAVPTKPQRVIDKGRRQNLKKLEDAKAKKRNNLPQPDPKKIKTDAPGTGASSGNKQPRPARKPKYKPEPTSKSGSAKTGSGEVRETPMTREEVLATLKKGGFDEAAPFGPRNPGAKAGYDGLERAFKRQKIRDASKRTKGVTKKTPIGRERAEAQVARRKKAGGNDKLRNADTNKDLGGNRSVARMSPQEIEKALADPRSSASRLMRKLETRARRGNLREGEMQTLNRLRDNAPKAVSKRKTEGLMDSDIRSKGQGQPALGERTSGSRVGSVVNPPRNVKASNQKWRGEGGKDAPKGPSGKSGTPKRGDNAAMKAKEEDGVTRNKGKGGQRRRVIEPSTDLVPTGRRANPTTRGRRIGGSTSRGSRPIPLGSGRRGEVIQGTVVRGGRGSSSGSATRGERVREPIDLTTRPMRPKTGAGSRASGGKKGKEVAVRGRGTVATTANAKKAGEASKKGMSKKKKALAAAALTGSAAAGFLSGVGQEAKKNMKDDKPKAKMAPKRPDTLRDKYGRKISRAEYNKREAYREKIKGMTPAQKKAARKAEMERREAFRKGEGATKYGESSSKITRNLWMKEGVSSREANMDIRGSKTTKEARKKIKKYKRKKK